MRLRRALRLAFSFSLALLAGCATVASGPPVTAYQGARVIVGDGSVIEDATLLVQGEKIAQVGPAASVRVPADAMHVSLAGKTAMPMLIDTHVHLGAGREAVVRDLRRRAYYGVSAALSLGADTFDVLDLRGQATPGTARFLSAGRGITMQEPGRTTIPYWVTSETDARNAVRELAAHNVDIVKIWVDTRDGKYKKLTPEIYGAIIDEAHKRGLRVTAHILIVAATRNSAEFLRLKDTGTLHAGKSADFIVLDANPLDDITHTRRISAVVLRGTPVNRSKPPN